MKYLLTLFVFTSILTFAQKSTSSLTVEKIMQDPKWIGSSPTNIQWDRTSTSFYFKWNPDRSVTDSLYSYSIFKNQTSPAKVSIANQYQLELNDDLIYSQDRSMWTFQKNGNIYYQSNQNTYPIQITSTIDRESDPSFSFKETAIVYTKGENLYSWNIADGTTTQLTNFIKEPAPKSPTSSNIQETWLKADQLRELIVLSDRKHKKDLTDSILKKNNATYLPKPLKSIYIEDKVLDNVQISPEGRYVTYTLTQLMHDKNAAVPNYVTESGFTTMIPARTKVGAHDGSQDLYFYDKIKDTLIKLDIHVLDGIRSIPEYFKDYPDTYSKMKKDSVAKLVNYSSIIYSPSSGNPLIEILSNDYKDRWLCIIDFTTNSIKAIDHQHDEAWIAGPGIGSRFGGPANMGWLDDDQIWYQSEVTGYSHLYSYDLKANKSIALTQGKYEVQRVLLSNNKKTFFLTTNEVHPGEQHFYHLSAQGGSPIRITNMPGADQVTISPDEKYLAFRNSTSTHPWELYIQENKMSSIAIQITDKAMSPEFKTYPWRTPDLITFDASDHAKVYARLYKPDKKSTNKAAVIFVHGAGYLQNAHKWWSSYFREYMFNNMLTDLGYTVMDIDYRGSAGYGRDWRTGIYRHMGGKDLSDNVDAAHYLSNTQGVDPKKIGVYGGSYGGFITLMGLFTTPDVFAAGAALRPVTDWAQYNHPYTANILNEPATDSIAYHQSSPWYYANGLKNALLICHGMVDVNVHYQDAVKLAQRLIELKKENWELASYPMEDHGFVEPSSWTDEYKRILKLFNQMKDAKNK